MIYAVAVMNGIFIEKKEMLFAFCFLLFYLFGMHGRGKKRIFGSDAAACRYI